MPANRSGNSGYRLGLLASRVMQWASAVIVMGICSYFIHNFSKGGLTIEYVEVVSCIAIGFYLPALFLPFLTSYMGWYLPLDVIFSYLWLTAFILTARDYNRFNCRLNAPPGFSDCALKHAMEAFIFLAFFFTLTSGIFEALYWDSRRVHDATATHDGAHREKEIRPSGDTAATA